MEYNVEDKFPCGHRKIDWDNSYGTCIACVYIKGYWYDEKEHEELIKQLEIIKNQLKELQLKIHRKYRT